MLKESLFFACVLGPTSLMAIVMWWWDRRFWGPSIGVLASAAGIVLFLPIRFAFHTPSGEFDGFVIFAEFLVIGGFLALVHFGSVFIIIFDRGDR